MMKSSRVVRGLALALALLLLLAGGAYWSIQLPPDPNALSVGARAPSTGALVDPDGRPFALASLQGLPVLVFYRGHW